MRDVGVCDVVNWPRARMRACFCMSSPGSSVFYTLANDAANLQIKPVECDSFAY